MSRLSRNHRILFVETVGPDPLLVAPLAHLRPVENYPNITVLRIQFPSHLWTDGALVDRERRNLLKAALAGPLSGEFENPVQWFYDPMAVTAFAGHMGESAIVYDCMDELSQFRGAPPELIHRERELLAKADVVFTGGRQLHQKKSRSHSNCHFYGCGVDVEHFGRARHPQTRVPPDLQLLGKPVLGFFGVIDERMDYELLVKLAEANPDWSIALIGPVLKVDEGTLPHRPNLHWLGRRDYSQLPAYCKGFSACIMPFALNEATEFINPTKALEYMATGRMIVSSAVPDVVRNFGSVVRIGHSHEEFISHCHEVLRKPDPHAIQCGLRMAEENTWEAIVAQLEQHVLAVIPQKAVN